MLWPAVAAAQDPIVDNDYNLDAVTGPVLGSSRAVGLGGAYTALADGIGGAAWNPASFGSRTLYELDWWEWDLALSFFSPGVFGQSDFFNNEKGLDADKFFFMDVGLRLQFYQCGFGFDSRLQIFNMTVDGTRVDVQVVEGHAGIAYAFWRGQLVAGLGARVADLDLSLPEGPDDTLVHFTGANLEAGMLLRIAGQPWRIGVAGRLPVESTAQDSESVEVAGGVRSFQGFVLPDKVYMPWEVQVGFAWQLGDRPLNRLWTAPRDPEDELTERLERKWCRRAEEQLRKERQAAGEPLPADPLCPDLPDVPEDEQWWEREDRLRRAEEEALEVVAAESEERVYWTRRRAYEDLSRSYLLLSAELLVIGPTPDGIGVDGFLEQQARRSGESPSLTVRFGAETEPIANVLQVRAGFYLEPARGQGASDRPHGTVGLNVRLFRWDLFGAFYPFDVMIGATCDFAPRYVDFGLGVGFWH